jgi:hypothetical protein
MTVKRGCSVRTRIEHHPFKVSTRLKHREEVSNKSRASTTYGHGRLTFTKRKKGVMIFDEHGFDGVHLFEMSSSSLCNSITRLRNDRLEPRQVFVFTTSFLKQNCPMDAIVFLF